MSSWQVARVLSEAQVTLQEGRGMALVFQLLFRETTRGGMKVVASEGLQLELDIRFLSSLGGGPLPWLLPGPHQAETLGRVEGHLEPGCAG